MIVTMGVRVRWLLGLILLSAVTFPASGMTPERASPGYSSRREVGLVLVPVDQEPARPEEVHFIPPPTAREKREVHDGHKKYQRLAHSVHVQSDIRYRSAHPPVGPPLIMSVSFLVCGSVPREIRPSRTFEIVTDRLSGRYKFSCLNRLHNHDERFLFILAALLESESLHAVLRGGQNASLSVRSSPPFSTIALLRGQKYWKGRAYVRSCVRF